MTVTSGCAGSSENVARHARPVSSGQVTVTASSARVTATGPGRTRVRSSGTDAAAAGRGRSIRTTKRALRIVLGPLLLQERDRSLQLFEAIHPVLHGNPAGESRAREDSENRIVIDQALAGFAMPQLVGVANRAVAVPQLIDGRARRQISIGGVHRDHAREHLFQKPYRIVAADERVRRIVLHTEPWGVDAIENLQEYILGLRELGILPGAVFVVVFQTQHDITFLGILNRAA